MSLSLSDGRGGGLSSKGWIPLGNRATALTAYSRRSLDLLAVWLSSKAAVEGSRLPLMALLGMGIRPMLLFVRFKFSRVEVAVEVLLTLFGERIDAIAEVPDESMVK